MPTAILWESLDLACMAWLCLHHGILTHVMWVRADFLCLEARLRYAQCAHMAYHQHICFQHQYCWLSTSDFVSFQYQLKRVLLQTARNGGSLSVWQCQRDENT